MLRSIVKGVNVVSTTSFRSKATILSRTNTTATSSTKITTTKVDLKLIHTTKSNESKQTKFNRIDIGNQSKLFEQLKSDRSFFNNNIGEQKRFESSSTGGGSSSTNSGGTSNAGIFGNSGTIIPMRSRIAAFLLFGTGLLVFTSAGIVLMFPVMDKYFFPLSSVRTIENGSKTPSPIFPTLHEDMKKEFSSRFEDGTPTNVIVLYGEAGSGKSTLVRSLVQQRPNSLYISLRNTANMHATVFELSDAIFPVITSSYFKFIQVVVNVLTLNNAQHELQAFNLYELLHYVDRGLKLKRPSRKLATRQTSQPLIIVDHLDAILDTAKSLHERSKQDALVSQFHAISRWAAQLTQDESLAHTILVVRSRSQADFVQKSLGAANVTVYEMQSLTQDQIFDFVEKGLRDKVKELAALDTTVEAPEEMKQKALFDMLETRLDDFSDFQPAVAHLQKLVTTLKASQSKKQFFDRFDGVYNGLKITRKREFIQQQQQQEKENGPSR